MLLWANENGVRMQFTETDECRWMARLSDVIKLYSATWAVVFGTPGAPRTMWFAALNHISWLWNHLTTRANPGESHRLTYWPDANQSCRQWCRGSNVPVHTLNVIPWAQTSRVKMGIFIEYDIERNDCIVHSKKSRKEIKIQHVRIINRSPRTPTIKTHETGGTENKYGHNLFSLLTKTIGEAIDETKDNADNEYETLDQNVQVLPIQASDTSHKYWRLSWWFFRGVSRYKAKQSISSYPGDTVTTSKGLRPTLNFPNARSIGQKRRRKRHHLDHQINKIAPHEAL